MRSRTLGAALAALLLAPPAGAQNLALHEMAAALVTPVVTGKFAGNPLTQSRGDIVLADGAVTLATVTNGRSTPVRLQVDVIATDTLRRTLMTQNGDIAFQSFRDADISGEIFAVGSDGSGPRRLTTLGAAQPDWSPDGRRIVFQSGRDGNNEIYVMNADGTGQTRLTNAPLTDNFPFWSPDGSRIAFLSRRDGNREIYVMNADGSEQTRLTTSAGTEDLPVWSPDSRQIVFNRRDVATNEIHVVNADGSGGLMQLTANGMANFFPAWSPDGTQITWSRGGEVWVMNADGSGKMALTNMGGSNPVWSPDGRKIAFVRADEIWVMNADGSAQMALTNLGGADPVWSPGGTQIAFLSFRDGNPEIYVMNADGTGQRNVSQDGDRDFSPDWGVRTVAVPSGDAWRSTSFTCDLTGRETTTFVFTPPGGGPLNLSDRAELYVECSDPDDPNGDPRSFLLPGQTGVLFVAASDPQTGASLGQDILFGDAVVVDLSDGQAYSFGAIPFQAGHGQNDGDKVYRFDGQEYARFPGVLATNFLTPNGAGVNAELILFTLDGTTGATAPPRARLGGFAYNDDEDALDFQHEFDCFDIIALGDVNPNLINSPGGPGLGTLSGHLELVAQPTATANDAHDDQYGDGNDTRTRPVHGWLVQQVRGNATLAPTGQPVPAQDADIPNAGGPAAWGRPLAQSRTAAVPFRDDDPATLDADVRN